MARLWTKISGLVSQSYGHLSEKAEELTRIGRVKLEILALKRDIEKALVELGGRIYQLSTSVNTIDLKKDPELQKLIAGLNELEKKLDTKKKMLDKLKKDEGIDID